MIEDLRTFTYLENGSIMYSPYSSTKCSSTLLPGFYKLSAIKEYGKPIEILCNIQEFHEPKVSLSNYDNKDSIDKYVNHFFSESIVKKISGMGFLHKGAVLFHGKEGTGKTTAIKNLSQDLIKSKEAIVFYIDPCSVKDTLPFIKQIRNIQSNPIIIVVEEIDGAFGQTNHSSFYKSFMDGNESISNIFMFATTNHLSEIPKALLRPSRFKYIEEFKPLSELSDVQTIVSGMTGNAKVVEELCHNLVGKTLDEIKHAVLDHVFNLDERSKVTSSIGFKVQE